MIKDFLYRFSLFILILNIVIAVFGPIIANDKVLFGKKKSEWFFPAFKDLLSFGFEAGGFKDSLSGSDFDFAIYPLIKFSPGTIDQDNSKSISPKKSFTTAGASPVHWLGTDRLGRDVASGLIYGARTALVIASLTVFIAFLIGSFTGVFAGYYMNSGIRLNLFQYFVLITVPFVCLYYLFSEFILFDYSPGIFVLLFIPGMTVVCLLIRIFGRLRFLVKYHFPLDLILVKIIEIRKSIPALFLVLAFLSLFRYGSVWNIIIILSVLLWTEFARYARAETLAVKEENYVLAARVMGLTDLQIMFRHIFPNIASSLIVLACFSAAGAVLLESTLSFLGIGLPAEAVSWGRLLAEGRNMRSWWLVIFPGLCIFFLILSLNVLSDRIRYNKTE
ncbi:MAG: ABC transporter permease [Saprospiraceae bacterium]|nr:ABC transporter permease [Saprospiraceae bacterium]